MARRWPARAVEAAAPPAPLETVPPAALETRLAYVVTGDEGVDAVSREGLQGLSSYANARTSAQLGQPEGVVPGRDDLAFYPMIYWPVTPATVPATPAPAWTAALASYMGHGGILLIDTQGIDPSADQGTVRVPAPSDTATAGFTLDVPGTRAALRRATAGLDIPSLRAGRRPARAVAQLLPAARLSRPLRRHAGLGRARRRSRQ